MQRVQLVVDFPGQFIVPDEAGRLQLGTQFRCDVRRHGNAADAACRVESKRHVVIAGQLDKVCAAIEAMGCDSGQIAARVLDPDNARNFGKARNRLGQDVGDRPSGNVVEDDRQIALVGQMGEMGVHAFLVRAVVIGRNHERCRRAFRFCKGHVANGRGRIVRATTGNHRNTTRGFLDAQRNNAVMLVEGKGRTFPGRAARDKRTRAFTDLPVDETPECDFVNLSITKWRHERRN